MSRTRGLGANRAPAGRGREPAERGVGSELVWDAKGSVWRPVTCQPERVLSDPFCCFPPVDLHQFKKHQVTLGLQK